jgi:hypothetical protein
VPCAAEVRSASPAGLTRCSVVGARSNCACRTQPLFVSAAVAAFGRDSGPIGGDMGSAPAPVSQHMHLGVCSQCPGAESPVHSCLARKCYYYRQPGAWAATFENCGCQKGRWRIFPSAVPR